MSRFVTSQGRSLLAMMPHADLEKRLASALALNPSVQRMRCAEPGLLERGGELASALVSPESILFGGGERPPAPKGSPARIPDWAEDEGPERTEFYTLIGNIALIGIEDVLTPRGWYDWWDECWIGGYRQIINSCRAAAEDDRVDGVLFCIDSPGGLVQGNDEAAAAIRDLAAAKPCAGHATLMASAAMLLGSFVPNLYADKVASIGSIGVRISFWDIEGALERFGERVHSYKSGALKDMGAYFRAPTQDEAALFQAEVDHWADQFYEAVAAGRGIDLGELRETHGFEAKVFTAGGPPDLDPEAVGLIDSVLTQQQAFNALTALVGAAGPGSSAVATGRATAHTDIEAADVDDEETVMSLQAKLAALQAKAKSGDADAQAELEALQAQLGGAPSAETDEPEGEDGVDDPEGESDGEDPEGEDGDDDPEGEADGDDPEGEGDDDDDEPSARSDAGRKIAAIAAREGKAKLGGQLAADVGSGEMTYKAALRTLKAAAREENPVRKALAKGRNGARPAAASEDAGKGEARALLSAAMKRRAR
ncbi:S49 family peptidase [Hyphobacterium sp.]|uniref:S49 family peptidase n=1 Tax=Hyphobacterium sp. TaxID=2004662 RepID=UPI003B5164AC